MVAAVIRRRVAAVGSRLAAAVPAHAELSLFETPGITLGDDAVECTDQGSYRHCASDAGTERVLSHDGLPAAERIPLDFQLYLPAAPASGPDGLYPLVVFIHGWGGSNTSIGGGVESEFVPYAEGGYAVLAYSARAWGSSCGATQQTNPECDGQWNHLADIRYEVRDTQYFAGLLADELSDDGTPLVDPAKIGVTGVSYGGGQSTMLTSLRNRVVKLDGTTHAVDEPGRQTDADRRRSPVLGVDRPRLRAAAQRAHARLCREQRLSRSARRRAIRRDQVELRRRALRARTITEAYTRRPAKIPTSTAGTH